MKCDQDAAIVFFIGKSQGPQTDSYCKQGIYPESDGHQEVDEKRESHSPPKSLSTIRLLRRRSKKGCDHSAARHGTSVTRKTVWLNGSGEVEEGSGSGGRELLIAGFNLSLEGYRVSILRVNLKRLLGMSQGLGPISTREIYLSKPYMRAHQLRVVVACSRERAERALDVIPPQENSALDHLGLGRGGICA